MFAISAEKKTAKLEQLQSSLKHTHVFHDVIEFQCINLKLGFPKIN